MDHLDADAREYTDQPHEKASHVALFAQQRIGPHW
jgi:hypothetical protein